MATIILAGGLSSRMGTDKAGLVLGESTLIESLVLRFADVNGPVLVVARPDQEIAVGTASVVRDVYLNVGPLGGLHAGLAASPDDRNFTLACDMPFASPELARCLIPLLADHDAVVPMLDRGPEPLYAVYRKSCLRAVESAIVNNRLRMRDVLETLDVLYIAQSELQAHDPDIRSFTNINTPEDYQEAVRLARNE